MIYIIDHQDSFTWNVVHQFSQFDKVICTNYFELDNNLLEKSDTIVLSPGPGSPKDYPNTSKLYKKFKGLKYEVVGVSKDNIKSHLGFKKRFKVPFHLLSDEKIQVQKRYGVWGMKSFLGKKFMGTIRSTIVIDDKGKILKIWPNVRVKGHAQEVLEFIKSVK